MNTLFSSSVLILLMMFICSNHPLLMIIQTILTTLLTSWFLTQMMSNSWMSLILVLIWLGGLLIIFVYLTSLIPNEVMSGNMNIIMLLPLFIMLNPLTLSTEISTMKKMLFFATSTYNMMIPLILMYMVAGLSVTIYITSLLKSPMKQEMN